MPHFWPFHQPLWESPGSLETVGCRQPLCGRGADGACLHQRWHHALDVPRALQEHSVPMCIPMSKHVHESNFVSRPFLVGLSSSPGVPLVCLCSKAGVCRSGQGASQDACAGGAAMSVQGKAKDNKAMQCFHLCCIHRHLRAATDLAAAGQCSEMRRVRACYMKVIGI